MKFYYPSNTITENIEIKTVIDRKAWNTVLKKKIENN